MATINNAVLFWTFINSLDMKYKQWKTTAVVDLAEAQRLKELGIKTKLVDPLNDGEEMAKAGQYKVSITRRLYRRGKNKGVNEQPKCAIRKEDGSLEWFTGLVGNGTVATVQFNPYTWGKEGGEFGTGTSADFKGIIIEKLVEFVPEGGEGAAVSDTDDEGLFTQVAGERPEFKVPENLPEDPPKEELPEPQEEVVEEEPKSKW